MKKVYLLILLSCLHFTSKAQFGRLLDKATDRLSQTVNDRIEKEIEEAIDKMVNNSFDHLLDFSVDPTKMTDLGMTTKMDDLRQNYSFDYKLRYIMMSGEDQQEMVLMTNSKEGYFGIEIDLKRSGSSSFIVFDDGKMINFTQNGTEKTLLAINLPDEVLNIEATDSLETIAANAVNDTEFIELGTKKILGLNCHGYETRYKKTTTEIWITDEIDFNYSILGRQQQTQQFIQGKEDGKGVLIKLTSYSDKKKKKKSSEIYVDEIGSTTNTYHVHDYTLMSF